jgi:hypothetical protein
MTTHDQHSEATPPLEQVEPATPVTDREAERADSSIAPTGPSNAPTESNIPAAESAAARTDAGRHMQAQGSISNQTEPDEAGLPAAHTESAITGTETAGGMADVTPSRTESSTDRLLFVDDELSELRARWDNVQTGFVDDPQDCVQKADGLVSDVVEQLTNGFTEARSRLEQQWGRGEEASTEDLRVALKRYREFFDRLLAV